MNTELAQQLLQVVMGLYETATRLQINGMVPEASYVANKAHTLLEEISMKELGKSIVVS